jgi:hypothetical protein
VINQFFLRHVCAPLLVPRKARLLWFSKRKAQR